MGCTGKATSIIAAHGAPAGSASHYTHDINDDNDRQLEEEEAKARTTALGADGGSQGWSHFSVVGPSRQRNENILCRDKRVSILVRDRT